MIIFWPVKHLRLAPMIKVVSVSASCGRSPVRSRPYQIASLCDTYKGRSLAVQSGCKRLGSVWNSLREHAL